MCTHACMYAMFLWTHACTCTCGHVPTDTCSYSRRVSMVHVSRLRGWDETEAWRAHLRPLGLPGKYMYV